LTKAAWILPGIGGMNGEVVWTVGGTWRGLRWRDKSTRNGPNELPKGGSQITKKLTLAGERTANELVMDHKRTINEP
jgi:hypothetical protein